MAVSYGYIRPIGDESEAVSVRRQEASVKAAARLRGVEIDSTQGGGYRHETGGSTFHTLKGLLGQIERGDILFISEPAVLGDTPSSLLEHGSLLVGKGVEVRCSSTGAELDLQAIRQYLLPMRSVEREIKALKAQLAAERKEHAEEFKEYQVEFERQLSRLLQARGVTLSSLMKSADESKKDQDAKARARVLS